MLATLIDHYPVDRLNSSLISEVNVQTCARSDHGVNRFPFAVEDVSGLIQDITTGSVLFNQENPGRLIRCCRTRGRFWRDAACGDGDGPFCHERKMPWFGAPGIFAERQRRDQRAAGKSGDEFFHEVIFFLVEVVNC